MYAVIVRAYEALNVRTRAESCALLWGTKFWNAVFVTLKHWQILMPATRISFWPIHPNRLLRHSLYGQLVFLGALRLFFDFCKNISLRIGMNKNSNLSASCSENLSYRMHTNFVKKIFHAVHILTPTSLIMALGTVGFAVVHCRSK